MSTGYSPWGVGDTNGPYPPVDPQDDKDAEV